MAQCQGPRDFMRTLRLDGGSALEWKAFFWFSPTFFKKSAPKISKVRGAQQNVNLA